MARLVRFTPRYLSDARRLDVRGGTQASRDVGRALRALSGADQLPAPGDHYSLLPHTGGAHVQIAAHVRRVRGHNLWVWYRAFNGEVELVGLTDALRPTPPE